MRQAISRRVDRALNFSALWIGCMQIEVEPSAEAVTPLGGWKKFTSRGGGCHPDFERLSWIERDP